MEEIIKEYLPIILRSTVVYLVIVLVMRLYGQKEVGDMNLQDFVLILLISETTQHAMLGDNDTLPGGLVAFISIFIVNKILNILFYKFPFLSRTLEPKPLVIVNKGVVDEKVMKKLRMTHTELYELIREKGMLSPKEVRYGIMESDGNFSIIPMDKDSNNFEDDRKTQNSNI